MTTMERVDPALLDDPHCPECCADPGCLRCWPEDVERRCIMVSDFWPHIVCGLLDSQHGPGRVVNHPHLWRADA